MNLGIRNKVFTQDQISKIGNTIIYLATKIPNLNKIKVLNLLFIIEEGCIKKYGHPFFNIDFQLWKIGPIAKDIYIDLTEEPILLRNFIKRDSANASNIIAKTEFNNDQFSDNDIELVDLIIDFLAGKNADYLINRTRGQSSLWRKSALQYGVLEALEQGLINSTEYNVDFNLLFDESPEHFFLKERYEDFKEKLEFIRRLKRYCT